MVAAHPAQIRDHGRQVIWSHEHFACLRTLAGADHAAHLEQIHQPAGLGETDPQFALQHRGRPELGAHDQFRGLADKFEVIADVIVDDGP